MFWEPEVGNTADTPNPPWVITPLKEIGWSPPTQFDLGGV